MRFQPLLGWINGCCDVGRGAQQVKIKGILAFKQLWWVLESKLPPLPLLTPCVQGLRP